MYIVHNDMYAFIQVNLLNAHFLDMIMSSIILWVISRSVNADSHEHLVLIGKAVNDYT